MFAVYALFPTSKLFPQGTNRPGAPFAEDPTLQTDYLAQPLTDVFESRDIAVMTRAGLLVPEGAQCTIVLAVADVVDGRVILPDSALPLA